MGGGNVQIILVTPPRIKFVPDYPPRKGKLFEIPQPTQNKCFGVNSGGGGIYSRGGSVTEPDEPEPRFGSMRFFFVSEAEFEIFNTINAKYLRRDI